MGYPLIMTAPQVRQAAESAPAASLLRSAGLRSTGLRRAVLAWLDRHPHASATQVHAGLDGELGSVSHQAVYDALWAFEQAGLVRCIQPAGHPAHFERRVGDNHHHVVCRDCGRIEDVDCVAGAAPCLTPGQRRSFDIDEAEVVFWGLCRDCGAAGQPQDSVYTHEE